MKKLLALWLTHGDQAACKSGADSSGAGRAIGFVNPDHALIIATRFAEGSPFAEDPAKHASPAQVKEWLQKQYPDTSVELAEQPLESPHEPRGVLLALEAALASWPVLRRVQDDSGDLSRSLRFYISASTPAVSLAWVLLAQDRYRGAEFVFSAREINGSGEFAIPFDITYALHARANLAPQAQSEDDVMQLSEIVRGACAKEGYIAKDEKIVEALVDAVFGLRARLNVLLLADMGTGKEKFARLAHDLSGCKGRFVVAHAGAIADQLFEAEMFGHEKGAFTDGAIARSGVFRDAHNGTVFLDEFAELPLHHQVKLLRVLQEGEVTPVGSTVPVKTDFNLICATNRDLPELVASGKFRSDLYYRVNAVVCSLPRLAQRSDLLDIATHVVAEANTMLAKSRPATQPRELTKEAWQFVRDYRWPGNIRQLETVLRSAIACSRRVSIDRDQLEAQVGTNDASHSFEQDVRRLVDERCPWEQIETLAKRAAIARALELEGNNTKAAERLGTSRQNIANWQAQVGPTAKPSQDS